jgi:hypothetical protein
MALEELAARRKTTVDALLASPPPFWRPRYPLSQLCEEAIERASMLKRAGITPEQPAHLTPLTFTEYLSRFGHRMSKTAPLPW